MKQELLQLRIDADTLTALKETVGNHPEMTVSQFVRDAIREKLARDVYGVVSVPTPQTVRQGIAAAGNGDRDELPPPGERGDMSLAKKAAV